MIQGVESGYGGAKSRFQRKMTQIRHQKGPIRHVFARIFDHFGRNIEARDRKSALRQPPRQVARAAPHVQHARALREPRQQHPLDHRERQPVKALVPVAVVEPGERIVGS